MKKEEKEEMPKLRWHQPQGDFFFNWANLSIFFLNLEIMIQIWLNPWICGILAAPIVYAPAVVIHHPAPPTPPRSIHRLRHHLHIWLLPWCDWWQGRGNGAAMIDAVERETMPNDRNYQDYLAEHLVMWCDDDWVVAWISWSGLFWGKGGWGL